MRSVMYLFILWLALPVSAVDRPQVIHVVVALCDNHYQGIVPVPEALGNGDNPSANLYWGALYGVKTIFDRSGAWQRIACSGPVDGTPIRAQCVYRNNNSPRVYLVAEAYRGRDIRQAVRDYFRLLAGLSARYELGDRTADQSDRELVVYVGHNGLMDFDLPPLPDQPDGKGRDAMVLACRSRSYFSDTISGLGGTPVLMTSGFMAPEAYTLEAALDQWISGGDHNHIRLRAAAAYHQYQKCGLKAARRLFGATTPRQ